MSYFFIFDSVVKCISNMCVGNWNLNMTIKFLYFKYEIQIPWLICHVINIGMAQKNSIKKKLDLNFALCFWNSICTSLCFSLLDVKSSCLCWMDGLRFIKLHIKFSGLWIITLRHYTLCSGSRITRLRNSVLFVLVTYTISR